MRCLVIVALAAACGSGSKDDPSPIQRIVEPPAPEAFCFNNRAKDTLRGTTPRDRPDGTDRN